MAGASLTVRSEYSTVEDLVEAGFSESEIEALSALKAAYPFVEYVDTASQWRRLLFLKWRYQHGDLQRA
jgi:hypothetical protein